MNWTYSEIRDLALFATAAAAGFVAAMTVGMLLVYAAATAFIWIVDQLA